MRFTDKAYQAFKDFAGEKPLPTPKPEPKNDKLPEAGDVTEPEQSGKVIKRDPEPAAGEMLNMPVVDVGSATEEGGTETDGA